MALISKQRQAAARERFPEIVKRTERGRIDANGQRTGLCPGHDDHTTSFSINQTLALLVSALAAALGSSAVIDLLSGNARRYLDGVYRRLTGKPVTKANDQAVSSDIAAQLERALGTQTSRLMPTLEARLAGLSELMAESSRLTEQVSAELDARAATARKLNEEAKQAEALASVNREQAEAIRRLLEADISEKLADSGKAIQRNVRRDAIRIAAAGFIAGAGVTLVITLLAHPLY